MQTAAPQADQKPTRVHVVIGILKDEHHQVLLSLRPKHKHLGDYWEFPGGKVEAQETPFKALQREFFEEVGIQVHAAQPFTQFPYDYPQTQVLLDFWLINEYSGTAHGKEGQEVKWVALSELSQYALPDANQAVVSLLMKKFANEGC